MESVEKHYSIMKFVFFSEFEASFLRLLDRMTNGSTIEINETGSAVYPLNGHIRSQTL